MNRPQTLKIDHLLTYEPLTLNQEICFDEWRAGSNLLMYGTAGTGKTFIGFYLALEDVMDKATFQDTLIVVRSVVPTREIGYLPHWKKNYPHILLHINRYVQTYLKMVKHTTN